MKASSSVTGSRTTLGKNPFAAHVVEFIYSVVVQPRIFDMAVVRTCVTFHRWIHPQYLNFSVIHVSSHVMMLLQERPQLQLQLPKWSKKIGSRPVCAMAHPAGQALVVHASEVGMQVVRA